MKLILQHIKRLAFNLEESLGTPPSPSPDKRKDMRQWLFFFLLLLLLQTGSGKQVKGGKKQETRKRISEGGNESTVREKKREKGADALLIKNADASLYRTWLTQMICRTFSFCCSLCLMMNVQL